MRIEARIRLEQVVRCAAACAWLVAAAASTAAAQEPDSLRAAFRIAVPGTTDALAVVASTAPGSSVGSPTAYGATWGDGYVGAGATHRARYMPARPLRDILDSADGSVSVGFGIGNSLELLALDVNVASYSTVKRGFGERMGVSFKLHRVLARYWGVAVGWENAFTRGDVDSDPSVYAATSKVWYADDWRRIRSVTATVGVGNGRFRRESDVMAGRSRWNVFASLGVRVLDPLSLIADWTGQDLVLGISTVPLLFRFMPDATRDVPLVVTLGAADVTGSAGDGVRFVLTAGIGFRWRNLVESL